MVLAVDRLISLSFFSLADAPLLALEGHASS